MSTSTAPPTSTDAQNILEISQETFDRLKAHFKDRLFLLKRTHSDVPGGESVIEPEYAFGLQRPGHGSFLAEVVPHGAEDFHPVEAIWQQEESPSQILQALSHVHSEASSYVKAIQEGHGLLPVLTPLGLTPDWSKQSSAWTIVGEQAQHVARSCIQALYNIQLIRPAESTHAKLEERIEALQSVRTYIDMRVADGGTTKEVQDGSRLCSSLDGQIAKLCEQTNDPEETLRLLSDTAMPAIGHQPRYSFQQGSPSHLTWDPEISLVILEGKHAHEIMRIEERGGKASTARTELIASSIPNSKVLHAAKSAGHGSFINERIQTVFEEYRHWVRWSLDRRFSSMAHETPHTSVLGAAPFYAPHLAADQLARETEQAITLINEELGRLAKKPKSKWLKNFARTIRWYRSVDESKAATNAYKFAMSMIPTESDLSKAIAERLMEVEARTQEWSRCLSRCDPVQIEDRELFTMDQVLDRTAKPTSVELVERARRARQHRDDEGAKTRSPSPERVQFLRASPLTHGNILRGISFEAPHDDDETTIEPVNATLPLARHTLEELSFLANDDNDADTRPELLGE